MNFIQILENNRQVRLHYNFLVFFFYKEVNIIIHIPAVYFQFSSSAVSNFLQPYDRSTLGLPVHHQLPEFTQTHVH